MKLSLALVSIIAFLTVDSRDVHDGRERRDSIDKVQNQVLIQRTDAALSDINEDGYADDNESFMSKKLEDDMCTLTPSCLMEDGECVGEGTCGNETLKAECGEKCSCCPIDKRKKRQIAIAETVTYTGPCPGHGVFENIKGACFWFSSSRGLRLNWKTSRKFCQNIGGVLGLDVGLANCSGPCVSMVLLMERIAAIGEWVWLGADIQQHCPFWSNDMPNTTIIDSCMMAWITGAYNRAYLGNHPCSDEMDFVCQIF